MNAEYFKHNRFMEGNLIIISFIHLCNLQISFAFFSIMIDVNFKLIAYFEGRKSFISNLLIDNHYCCQYPYVTVNQSRTSSQQSKVSVLKFVLKRLVLENVRSCSAANIDTAAAGARYYDVVIVEDRTLGPE